MADQAKPLGAGYEMTMVRTFEASPGVVFDCFIDPAHFARWWGPANCQNTIHKLEARPGGEISLRMAGPGFDHVMGGEYVEIERPNRLVFRTKAFQAPDGGWGIVNRITLVFEDVGGATRITMNTLVERAEGDLVLGALGGMRAGWGQSMERLGDLVGGGGKVDLEIDDRRIVLTRAFDAPRDLVWKGLTDPEAFARWWCAGTTVVEAMDVRPGGQWSARQTSPDGSSHLFFGEYVAVEPPARLTLTQGFDAYAPIAVEYLLTEEWGRTVLTCTMTFPDNGYRDGMLEAGLSRGVEASYVVLAALLSEA